MAYCVSFQRSFSTGNLVTEIVRTTGMDVISMFKATPHIRYTYHGQSFTLNQFFRQIVRPQWARSDFMGACRVTLTSDSG